MMQLEKYVWLEESAFCDEMRNFVKHTHYLKDDFNSIIFKSKIYYFPINR